MVIPILIPCTLLLAFLLWKELKRSNRLNLVLRIITSVLAVGSLACLILPVGYTKKISAVQDQVMLVTTGAASRPVTQQTFTTEQSLANTYTYIPDLTLFLQQHPLVRNLQVVGNGLDRNELDVLNEHNIRMNYNGSKSPGGFVSAVWQKQIRAGEKLVVEGRFENDARSSVSISLSGSGIRQDSTLATDSAQIPFRLELTPSHTGTTVYELAAIASNGTEWKEKIPVDIREENKIQVLILSSSPDFENKFLLSWLSNNHYPAAIRNGVSQDKYEYQFLNMSSRNVSNISAGILNAFDVIIANDLALAELNTSERSALQQGVDAGLGLIIQCDSTRSLSSFSSGFAVSHAPLKKTRALVVDGRTSTAFTPLVSYQVKDGGDKQPLITDQDKLVVVSSGLAGRGRIILNTMADTYSWMLAGKEADYARFWTLLLNRAARRQTVSNTWKVKPAFPVIHEQVDLQLETINRVVPVIETESGNVYLSQHRLLPGSWSGRFWPVQKGWQTLVSGDTCMLYIYDQGDWLSARTATRIEANRFYAADNVTSTGTDQQTLTQTLPFPKTIFFIGFIIACGYLWFEGKKNGV